MSTPVPAAPAAPAAPPVAPAAPVPAAPAAPAPAAPAPATDPQDVASLPPWAQKLIGDTRTEAAGHRTRATAAEQASQATLDNIAKALGITSGTPDPATLQASLTAAQDQARTAQLRAVLYETAGEHGANPAALRDSLSFLESVKGIDPTDTAAVVAAAQAAVTANAALAAAPAGPPRGPADLSGSGNNGPKQVTEDELTSMTPEEIVQAQTDGRLRNLLGG